MNKDHKNGVNIYNRCIEKKQEKILNIYIIKMITKLMSEYLHRCGKKKRIKTTFQ